MTIEEYLAQLEARLPRIGRRRILAETEEHLRDSAARHETGGRPRAAAEAAAVHDFGEVATVARRFASVSAIHETRLATVLALGAVALFVFPLYVVPENTLPPAPWAEKPRDIAVLQFVAIALWLGAGAFATASAVLAWTPWSRMSASALAAAAVALVGAVVTAAVLVGRWFEAAPVTPSWPLLAAPLAASCLLVCAGTTTWARKRRGLLGRDFVQD
jgi:HAAS